MCDDNKSLKFGLRKSSGDELVNKVCFAYEKIDFPTKFSLKDRVKQVYDQSSINSCSANACANFLTISNLQNDISRLYLYFCSRYIDNEKMVPVKDHGSTLKSVFLAMRCYHYIDETEYPYLIEKVNDIPSGEIFTKAIAVNKSPIVGYKQIIPSRYSIKYCLYKLHLPVLFGMQVFSNFFNLTKEYDVLSLPSNSDDMLGGHAVVIVGFDDSTETFEILNSHGSKFANDGYFKMPYSYALNPDLCFEFYVVTDK